jgi:histidinol-phosphate aminotransferase
VVVRTFSKLYALAGLRIGWAAAPPDVVKALLKTREPFSVSALASEAAQASLQDEDFFHRVRRETIDSRSRLMKALQERSQRFYPSATNFVSLSVGQEQVVAEALLKEGFVVRPADTFGLPGYLRITVGPWPIMEKFVASLDRVLGS